MKNNKARKKFAGKVHHSGKIASTPTANKAATTKALQWAYSQQNLSRANVLERSPEATHVLKTLLAAWADGAHLSWATIASYLKSEHGVVVCRTTVRETSKRLFPELVKRLA